MSIYAVYLPSWFPANPKVGVHGDMSTIQISEYIRQGKELHTNCKFSVGMARCFSCGSSIKWKKAWGHHSIPWGYGDVWCSKKCMKNKKGKHKNALSVD